MSIKVMSAIFESDLPPSKRLVMLALADHANDEGICYPSIARLCLRTGMKERTVQTHIRELEAGGHLSREMNKGRGGSNLYHLTPAKSAPPQELPPAENNTPPPQKTAQTPAKSAPKPSLNHNEPSEEPLLFPLEAKRRNPETDLPSGWVPSDANIQHAQEKGFTMQEIDHEADSFRNHHHSKQNRFRNWDAAWRTWIANAIKFGRGRGMAGKANSGGYGQGGSIASIVARRRAEGKV